MKISRKTRRSALVVLFAVLCCYYGFHHQTAETGVSFVSAFSVSVGSFLHHRVESHSGTMRNQPAPNNNFQQQIVRPSPSHVQSTDAQNFVILRASSDDSADKEEPSSSSSAPESVSSTTPRKRRRKRKAIETASNDTTRDTNNPNPTTTTTVASTADPVNFDLSPRDDTPVQMQVKSVRDVVTTGGGTTDDAVVSSSLSLSPQPMESSFSSKPPVSATTSTSDDASLESSRSASSKTSSNLSFEQLLEDAKQMEQAEQQKSSGGDENNTDGVGVTTNSLLNTLGDEEGLGIKSTIGNALSLLVTADFFLVCAFLVWFLVGIFCSSILKNDFVQIAFNNNFERLVQPALGVLMIASIGSNFFKEEEDETTNQL